MAKHDLFITSINRIKFPRLNWSNRKLEELELSKGNILKKVIIAGDCLHDEKTRPFIVKINLETNIPEFIKVLRMDERISEMEFGPYDNGYLMVGLTNGNLLVFDVISLERLHVINLFNSPIT